MQSGLAVDCNRRLAVLEPGPQDRSTRQRARKGPESGAGKRHGEMCCSRGGPLRPASLPPAGLRAKRARESGTGEPICRFAYVVSQFDHVVNSFKRCSFAATIRLESAGLYSAAWAFGTDVCSGHVVDRSDRPRPKFPERDAETWIPAFHSNPALISHNRSRT